MGIWIMMLFCGLPIPMLAVIPLTERALKKRFGPRDGL